MPIESSGPGQTFRRLCRTNWPSGQQYHNPGIHDIIKLYLPSLDDCITACAEYNVNFLSNKAHGNGVTAGGLCTAVTIIKTGESYFPRLSPPLFFFLTLFFLHRCRVLHLSTFRADQCGFVEGEYCYLKNGTGNMDTFGRPNLFTSAILEANL